MTPYELNILIHIYTIPVKFPHDSTNLYARTIKTFIGQGIIISANAESGYKLTEKGAAWLISILQTPMPIQAWVDVNGKIIEQTNELNSGRTSSCET